MSDYIVAIVVVTVIGVTLTQLNPYRQPNPNEPEIAPGALPLLGHLHKLVLGPIHFFTENERRYGLDRPYTVLLGAIKFTLLPQSMAVEALRQPKDILNFAPGIDRLLHISDIMGGHEALNPRYSSLISDILTPAKIQSMVPTIVKAINEGLDELGLDTPNATLITTWSKLCHPLVARVSRIIIYGPEMGSSKAFHEFISNFTNEVVRVARAVQIVPGRLVPTFIKYCTKLPRYHRSVYEMLAPILAARRAQMNLDGNWFGPNPKPDDLLQAFMDARDNSTGAWPLWKDTDISVLVCGLAMASLHTTATYLGIILNHISDDEAIYTTLEKERGDDPMTADKLQKLDHFNSIFRETLRVYVEYLSFGLTHRVMQDFCFSNGVIVPEGRFLTVRGISVHRQAVATDEDPEGTFDPWRYVPEPGKKRVEATSTGKTLFTFGMNKHICPGRFFASAEVQLITAEIVRKFKMSKVKGAPIGIDMLCGIALTPKETTIVLSRK